jgi:3-oxoacyl-[acyl-carrier protein] reductase
LDTLKLASYNLTGKKAIVTGAGRGMGEAFARTLAANGAEVAICDVNEVTVTDVAKSIQKSGGAATAYKVDVSDSTQVARFIGDVLKKMKRIDILVNNAGVLKPTRFTEISESEWQNIMRINVDGVFYCCKYVVPSMIENRYGKIINMSSSAGRSASTYGGMHYTASKAAVLGITRHLARELAPYNINVNAVCPGSIDTPMVRESTPEPKIIESIGKIPWGRLGTAQEVANLVLFLASDASPFITGASIDINGAQLML